MRANKLETVLSRDHLACLAPPDMVLLMEKYPSGYGCLWWLHCPGPTRDWWFLNKGPCPVYCSGRSRHYVGNDVVDEFH